MISFYLPCASKINNSSFQRSVYLSDDSYMFSSPVDSCSMYISSNHSLLPPQASFTNSSLIFATSMCFHYTSTVLTFTSFSITNLLLLLPLYILVFGLGLLRWWKRRSSAPATSHADSFTYHMVAIEMIGIAGCGFYCCGVLWLMTLAAYCFYVTSNGQMCLHVLTCVEHHLAVVHPITYQRVKTRGEARIRNASIACIWLFLVGSFCLISLTPNFIFYSFFFLIISIAIVSFCSFSVLCVLRRPGPGQRVDQTKLRAFHTIMAIMGALLLRFGGQLCVILIFFFSALSEPVRCAVLMSGVWFSVPSSLVSPLLFLHRAGKANSDSRQG